MLKIDVVARCRNEMPFAARMLAQTLSQDGLDVRVLFMDCGSTDGSRDAAERAKARIVDVDPATYVPGAVLNRGMSLTASDVVAFINADCIPLAPWSLRELIEPFFADGEVVATYGRQVAREKADPLVRLEYERAFANDAPRLRRGQFFSMAASAVRRDAWCALPFDETLRYSEDVDWSHRVRSLGGRIVYAPRAVFEHSHDYTLREQFRRRAGEGRADAKIFRLGAPSLVGDLLRPLTGALVRDARSRVFMARGLTIRAAQAAGYFAGRAAAAQSWRVS